MSAPHNFLKAKLAAGEVTHGLWVGLADPYAAEIVATACFDWLLLDGEHAPNDMRSLSAQVAVLKSQRSAPVVRLPNDDPTKIKQILDIGAQNLLIPMIESAEQAERAVRACLYPPHGNRGVGSALARASGFSTVPDYLKTANREICVMLQVESLAGLAALEAICEVQGVDVVFLGPSDLAADMGYLGQPGHPAVKSAVLEALAAIRRAGKAAGVLSTDVAFIEACKQAGANFVGVGIDVTVLATCLRALAERYCLGGVEKNQ